MKKNNILKEVIIFILILLAILAIYNFAIWGSIKPEEKSVEITATATQNTISTGVTAVSILLPLTVAILGFSLKQNSEASKKLFCACIFFTSSLAAALYNLFRIPGMVNIYNLANDKPTGLLEMVQLISLFYGVVYLIWGAWRITKNFSKN